VPNLADHLFRQAREQGAKCALVFEDRHYSYSEIATRVSRIAGSLSEAGVEAGSRVGLMMHSRSEFVFYQQAIFALGAVVSPLNIFYRKSELIHSINSCDLEFLVIELEFAERLPQAGESGTASLKKVLVLDLDAGQETQRVVSAAGFERSATQLDSPVSVSSDSTGLMLNTSATTGKAKGVILSIANIQANYDPTPGWLGLDKSTVTLCALPLYNTFGLNQCINALMVTGGTMVLMSHFDAGQCLLAIAKYRCTFFPAVPTMLQKLLDHPDTKESDLTSINRIMTGGAPVPAALLERINHFMGPDTVVMTGYGLTEATAIVSLEHIKLDSDGKVIRPKSIGRVLPGIEMKIVGENGDTMPPGEVGEICVSGPNVMQGYYKMPEETAAAVVDGRLRTGDLGMIDSLGYAYIVDRKKDVIIRGGQNIYPADIEEVIYRHPAVREVAVIGVSDKSLGEVPVAYVALKSGEVTTSALLIAKCKDELAYFKVPAAIYFLPELPKGPTGKIIKRELRTT
jgi:long-chain acyl-CoA synthetase